jgi:A/G-specific adenine glycosylase
MSPKQTVPLMLKWFTRNARDLPWRRTRDPYAIWVSEIMLQQTQVSTVIPFWNRWMRALPTINSLARARPGKIHKLWEGLGYYTRVRNLQKAARVIVEEHRGEFPTVFEHVLALPGIGRYTAGAICSIAFDQPKPILDGNVIRVLSRAFGIEGDPRDKVTNAKLWELAEQLVREAGSSALPEKSLAPPSHPALRCSQFNQSLMELGALVCTPRNPKCDVCPIAKRCFARKHGRAEALPNLAPRPRTTRRRFVAFVARRGAKVLVRQRSAGVVNAQLWEFPNIEVRNSDGDVRESARKVLGAVPSDLRLLCTIRHSITRYRIRLDVFQAASHESYKLAQGQWLNTAQLRRLAFASAHKKVLSSLELRRNPK